MGQIPVPKPYIREFEKLGYGMFIHWGLYSQLAQGEWVMKLRKIPKEEYSLLQNTFTAEHFDGREIARLAKRAGMKYIVLTARHHDGFSLYDTRGLSDYDSMHSPAARDLMADFAAGCRAEGIVPFFYHTTLDWYVDSYREDFEAYLRYLQQSVEILCTEYGKIGGMWFDGNWDKPDADWQEDALYGMIRRNQPEAIIVNNSGLHKLGVYGHPEIDSVTFEQGRPHPMDRRGKPKYVAAEMCQTMGAYWGYSGADFAFKSTKELIEHLCACRKVGANYLLNIGLTGTGRVAKLQEAMLETIGDWLRVFGQAIYTTAPCGIAGSGSDFGLAGEDGKLYFFVHQLAVSGDWNVTVPSGGVGPRTFTGVRRTIRSIRWMDNGEELSFVHDPAKDLFSFQATGYPYGEDYVVRVAEAVTED
ncbi:alpha-L-fucosidase [Cohnella sp. CFH 77786]|uniref:alpha-L-fucosidase n=1 Tax=Cohnella sp. CFH 77786 TaxID=2662265 RepID=UPI001C60CA1E|nr:alpha-L-fucosidase [Cohnella sp. CFH 77786]MBW5448598.1 alpha-L-fucosidase [Cohnella sp. CFH 77786]